MIRILLTVATFFAVVSSFAANGKMPGSGTDENPWLVEDYEDLKLVGDGEYSLTGSYRLTSDIDGSPSASENCVPAGGEGCNGFEPIGQKSAFKGKIDGDGHTISNLMIWFPCSNNSVGFISKTDSATIMNLNFRNLNVVHSRNSGYAGGLVGYAKGEDHISDVHVQGKVDGYGYVGGFVGYASKDVLIENSSFEGSVSAINPEKSKGVGGIAGIFWGEINNSYANVEIPNVGDYSGGLVGQLNGSIHNSHAVASMGAVFYDDCKYTDGIGGLVGYNEGFIYTSYATVSMDLKLENTVNSRSIDACGGVAGYNYGYIEMTYATGEIFCDYDVGGLAGINTDGVIKDSYAMVNSRGNKYVGGLVGYNKSGNLRRSYSAGMAQGKDYVGAIVGFSSDSERVDTVYWDSSKFEADPSLEYLGTGLGQSEVYSQASYAGFDFEHVWAIEEGKTYPYLKYMKMGIVAAPTSAASWSESPVVASALPAEGTLVGRWTGFSSLNVEKDSIYHYYQIGSVVDGDTAWGGTSHMAVPNRIEISNYEQLKSIGKSNQFPLCAHYELTKDIDAQDSRSENCSGGVCQGFEPIGDSVRAFTGDFNGNFHTIKNLHIDRVNSDFVGLFGALNQATVKELVLDSSYIRGGWLVGAVAGRAEKAQVTNVASFNATIKGSVWVGGLFGEIYYSNVSRVASSGKVRAASDAGGIAGFAYYSYFADGYSLCSIHSTEGAGGLFGLEADYENNLERFYFAGQIASTEYKGLYSASDHMKVPVGKCKNCYWDKDVVQHNFKDTTALTTAQMKKSASFVGFDFDTTWTIDEDKTYPYFKNLGKSEPAKFDTTPKTVLAGDGTKDYPYNVTSYDDLMAIGSGEYTLDKHYYQTQDIDASMSHPDSCKKHGSEFLYEPIGTGTGLFDGVYDGGGNSITNLWLQADRDTVGLFYGIGTKGTVQNLTLKAFNVQGKNYVGALAGVNSGTLSKVGVQNLVKPDECKCSYNDTIVVTEVKGIDFVGCMLGAQTGGATSQSYTVCNVEGSEHVGGFAGALSGAADNSLSKAMVLAKNIAGGFAGSADAATMDKVYAAGFVKTKGASPISGGIVGSASKSVTLTNSYYDYETTFQKGDAYGTPYTTRQMTDSSNFKNWDFSNIWCIKADTTYPYLAWAKDTLVPNEWRTGDLTMSGSGTLDDPFLVKTYEDLKKVGYAYYSLSAHYRLANDVDASASRTENCVTADSCLGFKPIGSDSTEVTSLLKGSFNGAGHTISDLYSNHHNYVGLFLGVDTTGLVDSLNLEGFEMRVDYSGAAVAAYNYGNIQNVYVRASVGTRSGKDVGGIVNENYGTISNVRFKGDLLGEEDVGGIAVLNKGVIEKASAEVAIHSLSGNYVGGLVSTNRGSIAKSFVTGTIEGDAGFVYKNSGEITACYAMADVQGVDNASGFVYENYGAISDVYAIGILSALYNSSRVAASGFGYYFGNDATVKRVYAVNTLFQTNSGSSCFTANGKAEDFLWNADLCKDSASAGAFSSTMMKKSSSYANWDFENVWDIQEGASYPYLRGMVNLPVAFADTIYTEKIPSLDELVAALLKNDFAGSENKSGLVTKLDSVSLKNFNALKKPDIGDFVQVRYRAGAILGKDTLWGNEAESYLIFGEKPVVTEIAGDGTEDSPWLIRDYDDLKMIGSGKYTLDGHYRLANDINASMSSVENCFTRDSCNGFQAFAFDTTEFTGHFHGAGHTIKNLHTNTGLVGFPGYTAVLDSLTLEVDVPNGVAIGPLGRTNYGTIQHVHVSGKIRGTIGLGGLFYANDGTMRDVSFEGSITGASHSIGGIVYSNIGSIITSKATLVANDTLIYQTGGIASINYQEGIIDSCSASGILYGSRDVGGLVAVNQGTVQHSMTSAKVKGDHAGGLVGYNNGGALRWNFSTGDVTGGTYVGGIAGINQGTISSCFSTGKVLISEETQFSYKGTLAGNNAGVIENVYAVTYDTIPLQGLGEEARLTKAFAIPADGIMREMLNADSYKDFDFDSVWFQSRGATLPNLRGMANIPYVFVDTLSVSMESEKGATAFDAGYALTTFKNSVLSLAYLENGDKNTLIFKFDSASEATVEKKKLKDGEILGFTYRLGRLIGTDTLWGPYASSAVVVEQTNGIVPALHFAMKVIRTGDMVDVRYSIPRQGHVKFVLADFQGRVLRSLSSGMKNAGSHAETMKLQGMPQGRYRIIMTVDGKVVRHFGI